MPSGQTRTTHYQLLDEDASTPSSESSSGPDGAFNFINYSHPGQAKLTRKRVRSHVTKLQHQQTRAKKALRAGLKEPSINTRLGDVSLQNPKVEKREDEDDFMHDFKPPRARKPAQDVHDVILSGHAQPVARPSQLAMEWHNPFDPYSPSADWHDDVPGLVDHFLGNARDFLQLRGHAKEASILRSDQVLPELYIDSFLYNAIITLACTRIGATGFAQQDPGHLVSWLRNNFIIMIQRAVETGAEAPSTLAIGIAMLIGWEVEFGDAETCALHSRALPTLLDARDRRPQKANIFSYPDRVESEAFRGGVHMSPGFEFYAVQNLLPPRLLFLISSLGYYDPAIPGARRWIRELWCSIWACVPTDEEANANFIQRQLRSRVAQVFRTAGSMLGSLMRVYSQERAAAQPLTDGIVACWSSTLGVDWSDLVGTVYDEILLWTLCTLCITSEKRVESQILAIQRLLSTFGIADLDTLRSLLERYLCPPCIHDRLARLWCDLMLDRSARIDVSYD